MSLQTPPKTADRRDATEAYARHCSALKGRALPCAYVDLDAVDRNVDTLLAPLRENGRRLRIATKSLRCWELIRYIRARSGDVCIGLMIYDAREIPRLTSRGARDLLLAYPTLQPHDAALLARANAEGFVASVVVDDETQLDALDAAGRAANTRIPTLVDLDASYRALGGRVHLGVMRSPVRTAARVGELAQAIAARAGLRFHGVMAYEAQIAGLPDRAGRPWMNLAASAVKRASRPYVRELRARVADEIARVGLSIEVFNGGGSGSVRSTSVEPVITEVTAGSGFVDSHLFDHYDGLALEPAIFFALQAVRRPSKDVWTCAGGGYIASGAAGRDRLPLPYLPDGLSLTDLEGAGEVQTPIRAVRASTAVTLGAPVVFRHAKAGELAERFNRYLFMRGDSIVADAETYRGEGLNTL